MWTIGVALALVGGVLLFLLGRAMLRTWPILAMALLTLGVYTNRYKFDVGPITIRTEHVVVLTVLGFLLLRAAWKGTRLRVTVPGLYALGWWLALTFSALINAPDPGDTIRHIVRLNLMVVTLLTTVNLVHTREDWHTLVRFLYIGGVLEAGFGVLARLLYTWNAGTWHLLGYTLKTPLNLGVQVTNSLPVPVPYGTLEEGNIFGSTVGAILVASIVLWFHPQRLLPRRWVGVGLVLSAVAWILSMTRGAWLAVLLVLPLLWVVYPRQSVKRLVHLGVLFVLAPLLFLAVAAFVTFAPDTVPFVARLRTLTSLPSDPTFNLRLGRMMLATADISLNPFIGWGPGTFVQLHGITYGAASWLESLTVKNIQEGGLFGLLFLYGLWLTTAGEGVWGAMRDVLSPERGVVLALALGGWVLFIAYHVTDATWLGFVWVWLGALATRPGGPWVSYSEYVERAGGSSG